MKQASCFREHRWNTSRPVRGGFTFLELLIVLSLIIVIASMVVPNLLNLYRRNQVQQAADVVRETLASSRVMAIDGGIDYQFLFEPGGQRFVVIPMELQPVGNNNQTAEKQTVNLASGQIADIFRIELPDDAEKFGQRLGPEWFGSLPDAVALSQVMWSTPIRFHFDGTANDAELWVVGQNRERVVLSVRGLTGAVSMTQTIVEAD